MFGHCITCLSADVVEIFEALKTLNIHDLLKNCKDTASHTSHKFDIRILKCVNTLSITLLKTLIFEVLVFENVLTKNVLVYECVLVKW